MTERRGPGAARRALARVSALAIMMIAALQPAIGSGAERWYQIEILLFLRLDADRDIAASGERFEPVGPPILPWGAATLLSAPAGTTSATVIPPSGSGAGADSDPTPDNDPALFTQWFETGIEPDSMRAARVIRQLADAALAAFDAGLTPAPAATSAPASGPESPLHARRTAPARTGRSGPADPSAPLAAGARTLEIRAPNLADAWVALPPDALRLQPHWRRMRGSAGYRPLLLAGWRQPLPRDEAFTLWLTGEDIGGTLAVRRQRFLHVAGDFRFDTANRPALRTALASLLIEDATVGDSTPAAVASRGRASEPAPSGLGWHFERRMRSEELHYVDHPVIGALVRIDPWFGEPLEPSTTD